LKLAVHFIAAKSDALLIVLRVEMFVV